MGSVKRNIGWALGSSLSSSLAQWGILVLYARWGGAELAGTFALAQAIAVPVFLLFSLQLRGIQAVDAAERYPFRLIWRVRAASSALAILTLLTVGQFLVPSGLGPLLWVYGFAKALESMSDAIYGRLQRQEKFDWIAQSVVARGALGLALTGSLFVMSRNLFLSVFGLVVANLSVLVVLDIRRLCGAENWRIRELFQVGGTYRRGAFRDLLRSGLPLGAVLMIGGMYHNIPRYFIEMYLSRADLGIYATLAQLISAGSIAVGAAGTAMSPRLANSWHRGDTKRFSRQLFWLYGLVVAVVACGSFIVLLAGETIVEIVLGHAYPGSIKLLVALTFAGGLTFAGTVGGVGLTAAGRHAVQVPLAMIVLASSAAFSSLLVGPKGLVGAALAVGLSQAVKNVGVSVIFNRIIRSHAGQLAVSRGVQVK